MWDVRKPEENVHSFEGHTGDVLKVWFLLNLKIKVEWSPNCGNMFASSSGDRRVIVWDLNKIGEE